MFALTPLRHVVVATLLAFPALPLSAAELVRLSPANWDAYVPAGKEVDCIYGDYVLRNELIVAVIAEPLATRNANMTVRNVGGALIDLTFREAPNDQLSAFYPGAGKQSVTLGRIGGEGPGGSAASTADQAARGPTVYLEVVGQASGGQPEVKTRYELTDGAPALVVKTTYANPHTDAVAAVWQDAIRADRGFVFGQDRSLNLFWAYDPWWNQAYGVVCTGAEIQHEGGGRPVLRYQREGSSEIRLEPGDKQSLVRTLIPGRDLLAVKAAAHSLQALPAAAWQVQVKDPSGPVDGAFVTLMQGEDRYGWGRTDHQGKLLTKLPAGTYTMVTESPVHPGSQQTVEIGEGNDKHTVELPEPGYLVAEVTDAEGGPIACKVVLQGIGETPDPDFGPDTYIERVQNLRYSANGRFRQPILPGRYRALISHGPEYDAIIREIEVDRGATTNLAGKLIRSVDTSGWVSSDFHSHSSPSGDNTSSQRGRVLNLLAEQIEFAPCTEHNRVSTYVPHLRYFDAVDRLATCSGMELTGSPLPINHQNAFPLKHRARTQDGGGPVTDSNPLVQIERLAMWDDQSEKLVQENHPNLAQIIADRNLDGESDGGFEAMVGWMDVIEIHPPAAIFSQPEQLSSNGRDRGNAMFHWLQMLNLGYRVPGVVNTDAHYNFHGSGWLRNYLRSETDDPAKIDTMEMVHAAEHGQLIMTNGPFLEVYLQAAKPGRDSAAGVGGDVLAPGGAARLAVKVQCPNWFDINRVQVFLNGQPSEALNYTRRSHPQHFGEETVKFDAILPIQLERDAHVIVASIGEGLQLGPVMGPRGETEPVAVSNPIFVDVEGDGFTPSGDMLGVPLPLPEDFAPSHGHSHSHSHSHGDGHSHGQNDSHGQEHDHE